MKAFVMNLLVALCLLLLPAGVSELRGGSIVAWGGHSGGPNSGNETNVPPNLIDAIAVSGGVGFTEALRATGEVVAWGNPPFADRPVLAVPGGLNNVVAISCAAEHTIALRSDGTVVGWGFNLRGQTVPPAGLRDVVAISANGEHSLALRSDGRVVGWGGNIYGESSIPADLSNVVAIRAGYRFSLALQNDGTVVGWGSSQNGGATVPAGVSNVVAISAGNMQALALRSDGTVILWGRDAKGDRTPAEGIVLTHFTNVIAIAGSTYHAMGLRRDGTLVQYPSNAGPPYKAPPNLSNIVAIATSGSHDMVLIDDQPRPRLSVRTIPGFLILSWRFNGDAFDIEAATPNAPFRVVSAGREWNNGAQQFEMSLPLAQPALLFRLRRR